MSDVQYYCTKTHSNVVQWTLDHAEKGRSSKELMFVVALNQETKHPEVVLVNGKAFNAYLVSSGKRQFIENQSGELVFIDNSKREMVGEAGEKVKFSILFEGYGKGPAGDYILAQSQRELDDLWKNLLQTNTPPPLVDFQRNFAIAEFPREIFTSPTEDSVKDFGEEIQILISDKDIYQSKVDIESQGDLKPPQGVILLSIPRIPGKKIMNVFTGYDPIVKEIKDLQQPPR